MFLSRFYCENFSWSGCNVDNTTLFTLGLIFLFSIAASRMIGLSGHWIGLVKHRGPFHQSWLLIIWGACEPRDAIYRGWLSRNMERVRWWITCCTSATRFATIVFLFEGKACIQANVIVLSVHAKISRFLRVTTWMLWVFYRSFWSPIMLRTIPNVSMRFSWWGQPSISLQGDGKLFTCGFGGD